ncbi:MAG: thioredoxin [Psychrobacillus psychrotolerans]|uniref:Thioredoxin n=1 Tax=Psychrobacillus psychrotolerans TaxID=126156 RepID=A0A1I5YSM6_9BACI|nr:thioredoxin [Psychrobacillus psychrotolerans]SFQ47152.1 thioredoxin [Psychrobacillus psychrotolerans]
MAIVHGTDQTFNTDIEEGLVLVDFWATWCGPCKMIAPVLEEMDAEMSDKVKIVKVDVDENQATASQFGIMSIPTLVLFKDGKPVDKAVGFQPKEALVQLVEKNA